MEGGQFYGGRGGRGCRIGLMKGYVVSYPLGRGYHSPVVSDGMLWAI